MNLHHLWRAEPTDQTSNVRKAFAYITRRSVRGPEVVVFTHADVESGVQVPKGTVEGGETPAEAALREAYEECGLDGLKLVRHLATDTAHFPNAPKNRQVQRRFFYEVRAPTSVPERWRHRVSAGAGDAGLTFTCFWLNVTQRDTVIANMGGYLHLLE